MKNNWHFTTNTESDEYTEQAKRFLASCGAEIKIKQMTREEDEKEHAKMRQFLWSGFGYSYYVRIKRGNKTFSFRFHDSLHNMSKHIEPSEYSLLACLEKYEIGDFWDFVSEFGYSTEGREEYNNAQRIYKAVMREYNGVMRVFGDVIEEMREIQ